MVIAFILLHKTKYGRRIWLALTKVQLSSGINSRAVIMSTYMFRSFAVIAGVVLTVTWVPLKSDLGADLTMDIITAVVSVARSTAVRPIVGIALCFVCYCILAFWFATVLQGKSTVSDILLVLGCCHRCSIGSKAEQILRFFEIAAFSSSKAKA